MALRGQWLSVIWCAVLAYPSQQCGTKQLVQCRSVLICRTNGFARQEENFMWRWGHLARTLDAPVLAHTLAVCFWRKRSNSSLQMLLPTAVLLLLIIEKEDLHLELLHLPQCEVRRKTFFESWNICLNFRTLCDPPYCIQYVDICEFQSLGAHFSPFIDFCSQSLILGLWRSSCYLAGVFLKTREC